MHAPYSDCQVTITTKFPNFLRPRPKTPFPQTFQDLGQKRLFLKLSKTLAQNAFPPTFQDHGQICPSPKLSKTLAQNVFRPNFPRPWPNMPFPQTFQDLGQKRLSTKLSKTLDKNIFFQNIPDLDEGTSIFPNISQILKHHMDPVKCIISFV